MNFSFGFNFQNIYKKTIIIIILNLFYMYTQYIINIYNRWYTDKKANFFMCLKYFKFRTWNSIDSKYNILDISEELDFCSLLITY